MDSDKKFLYIWLQLQTKPIVCGELYYNGASFIIVLKPRVCIGSLIVRKLPIT